LAESRLKAFYGKDKKTYEILQKFKGKDLEGKSYIPMFDFFAERKTNGCFKVQVADFVTDDSGTGIVHCAPGFG
jgi:isoleucyl-tRNA synthetase